MLDFLFSIMAWLTPVLPDGTQQAFLGPLAVGLGIAAAKKLFGGKSKEEKAADERLTRLDSEFDQASRDERARADGFEGDYRSAYDQWGQDIDQMSEGTPSNVDGWRSSLTDWDSTETRGFDPSGVTNFDPTETRDVGFGDLERFGSDELRGTSASNLAGTDPGSRLRREGLASTEGVANFRGRDFDAGAAMKEYAKGAYSDFERGVKTSLDSLRGLSVGEGRLDTGFFDKDQGDVITELGRGYTSDIAKQALNAAGITSESRSAADRTTLDAMKHGATLRTGLLTDSARMELDRAGEMDRLALDRAGQIDKNMLGRADSLGRLKLDRATSIDDARLRATTEGNRLALDRAGQIDRNKLDATKTADAHGLERATYMDENRLKRDQATVDARGKQTGMAGDRAESSRNRYLDALTGRINLTQQRKNAKAQSRDNFMGGLINIAGQLGSAYITRGK